MHKHNQIKKAQHDRSILKTVKESLSHVLIIGLMSMAGHIATTTLGASVGGVGASLALPVGMFLI